jgi:hypothetical protein
MAVADLLDAKPLDDTGTFKHPGWTPFEAAHAYAAARGRSVGKHSLVSGSDLAIEFQFVNGNAWYLAHWMGGTRDGFYRVGRMQ